MIDFYILEPDGSVRPAASYEEYLLWAIDNDRQIEDNNIADVRVSTVFVGLLPGNLFFETMVFGGPLDGMQRRSRTIDQARNTHRGVLDLVSSVEKDPMNRNVRDV